MEPLGGGAMLEEVPHKGQALKVYSLASLPLYILCKDDNVISPFHGPTAMLSLAVVMPYLS